VKRVTGIPDAVRSDADDSLSKAAACAASSAEGLPSASPRLWHALLLCFLWLLPAIPQPAWAEYVAETWRGGEFVAPLSVSADDHQGSCWVADGDGGEVVHLGDDSGELWSGTGFDGPSSLSANWNDGSCWVASADVGEIIHLAADGSELWSGTAFSRPSALSVNSADGSCWVADADAGQVIHLAADGTELWRGSGFGSPVSVSVLVWDGSCWVADAGSGEVVHLGQDGSELWRGDAFTSPVSVSVSMRDWTCWVADAGSGQVVHVATDGTELSRSGGFSSPVSVATNAGEGTCWVADSDLGQVVLLGPDGSEWWRGGGFASPSDLTANHADWSCWVADTGNGQVVRLAYVYTLTFTGAGGQVAVNGVTHSLPWVEGFGMGSPVTVEALPDATSDFTGWFGDFSGTTNPMAIVADADYVIGLEFAAAGHALTLDASGQGRILVDGVERVTPWSATFEPGVDVTVEALPASGWRFAGWAGDAESQASLASIAMDGDKQIEACFAASFLDVPADYWAAEAIAALTDANIVDGYPDLQYRPTLLVDRGSMAVYLSRALAGGDTGVPECSGEPTFPDVPADHWAYRYIEHAVSLDIVAGYGDGTYHADSTVTRGQMSVFIARAMVDPTGDAGLQLYEAPETASFTDVPETAWCFSQVEFLAESGVASGYADGTYAPSGAVTRDQMAMYIARALGLVG